MNKKPLSIGEVCNYVRGVTFDGEEARSSRSEGYLPILRAGNIGDTLDVQNDLIWVPTKRVAKEQYLQKNDIVICMSSGSPYVVGKTAQLHRDFTGSVGAFCGIIRVINADPLYVNYWFNSFSFFEWRNRKARGANIQNLRPSEILEIAIPLPPLSEQQRITAILQKADRIRQLRRYARQLSDGYLQSVFLEMFGDPETNPKGWKIVKSEELISSIRYGTGSPPSYIDKGLPFLRATNVKNGTIKADGLVYISNCDANKISKCKLRSGDLLLVRSGVNSGDCALIQPQYEGAYAAYDLIIEMSFPYNYFFNFIINSDYGKNVISTLSRRAGQPHINADQVKSIPVPLPAKEYVEKFANQYQNHQLLRDKQMESERQAEQLFQSLLHQAFEGNFKP